MTGGTIGEDDHGKDEAYYSPGSPYARKVRIVAMETKLDKKMEMVNVAVSPIAPNADVEKHNPIGKIPAPLSDRACRALQ